MPKRRTVTNWLLAHEDFRQLYARARDIQADLLAEDVLDIADDRTGDLVPGKDGKLIPDWENVQRSRLRVDARKWFAGKVAPKKYGERIMQELSGPEGGPIKTEAPAIALPPAQVAEGVIKVLEKAGRELGIKRGIGGGARAKAKLLLTLGQPVPPALYAALFVSEDQKK